MVLHHFIPSTYWKVSSKSLPFVQKDLGKDLRLIQNPLEIPFASRNYSKSLKFTVDGSIFLLCNRYDSVRGQTNYQIKIFMRSVRKRAIYRQSGIPKKSYGSLKHF